MKIIFVGNVGESKRWKGKSDDWSEQTCNLYGSSGAGSAGGPGSDKGAVPGARVLVVQVVQGIYMLEKTGKLEFGGKVREFINTHK